MMSQEYILSTSLRTNFGFFFFNGEYLFKLVRLTGKEKFSDEQMCPLLLLGIP